MYFLNDGWYRLVSISKYILPSTMKPITKSLWHYDDPHSLAASGIYTNIEREKLRKHIMFPAEKNGILNIMARGAKGEPIMSQEISFSYLFDENSLQKITENTWEKIWELSLIRQYKCRSNWNLFLHKNKSN